MVRAREEIQASIVGVDQVDIEGGGEDLARDRLVDVSPAEVGLDEAPGQGLLDSDAPYGFCPDLTDAQLGLRDSRMERGEDECANE
jgi:hypothetical protein